MWYYLKKFHEVVFNKDSEFLKLSKCTYGFLENVEKNFQKVKEKLERE